MSDRPTYEEVAEAFDAAMEEILPLHKKWEGSEAEWREKRSEILGSYFEGTGWTVEEFEEELFDRTSPV